MMEIIPDCSICSSSAKDGHFTPCCNQLSCKTCLQKWVNEHHTCPFCRAVLNNVSECIKAQRIVENLRLSSREKENLGIARMLENLTLGKLKKLRIVTDDDLEESAQTILDFLKISDKNQDLLLEKDLIEEMHLVDYSSVNLETRRIFFEILKTVCVDNAARREMLRQAGFEHTLSKLLVNNENDGAKQLNLDILSFLEDYNEKLEKDGINIFGVSMVIHETNSSSFCQQMEMAYNSVNGKSDRSSDVIRQLTASFAFLFCSSSVQSVNTSKFFDSLLQGISNSLHPNTRRKSFFLAIKNASKFVTSLSDNTLSKLLECLEFSNVCSLCQVLDLIVVLKEKIVGEANAKKVASQLYPVFLKQKRPTANSSGDIREIGSIMEIICTLLGTNNSSMLNFLKKSCTLYSNNSLIILNVLVQNSFKSYAAQVEKAMEYILIYQLEYIKEYMCTGDQGTTKVMAMVVGNHPKHVSRKNMEVALNILNECRSRYPNWS